jgi:hypothetical protein
LEISSRKSWLINARIPGNWAECGKRSEFWEWVEDTNCPIVLTEGERKRQPALISRGYARSTAGNYDGLSSYRARGICKLADGTEYQKATARELHEALQKFDTQAPKSQFFLTSATGIIRKSQEFRAAIATAKLVKSAIAKIAQLPGPDKGADDFLVGGGDIDAVISAAQTIEEIQKQILKGFSKKNRQKAWALTHPVAWECNQRYLDIPYPNSGLICIKSPKGTGKTYALKKLVVQSSSRRSQSFSRHAPNRSRSGYLLRCRNSLD